MSALFSDFRPMPLRPRQALLLFRHEVAGQGAAAH
jgi:hypothetical protein